MTKTRRALMMSATILFAAGCGSGAGSGGQAGATGGTDSGATGGDDGGAPDAPAPNLQRGEIRIIEGSDGFMDFGSTAITEQPYGRVDGRFYATHPPVWHTDVMTSGACTLKKFVPSQCPPPYCDGVCLAGTCQPYTSYVSAGTVTVTGLKLVVSMTGDEFSNNYYYLPNVVIPSNLYDTGATIGAHATGATIPTFDTSARGVTPLKTSIVKHAMTLAPHADHVVTWTPSSDAGARVLLTLNANNHGHGQPFEAIIVCEAADAAGSFTIPKAMVDAFPATANWQACAGSDCPRSTILRYVRGVADLGDGWVGLTIGSEVSFGIDHAP